MNTLLVRKVSGKLSLPDSVDCRLAATKITSVWPKGLNVIEYACYGAVQEYYKTIRFLMLSGF